MSVIIQRGRLHCSEVELSELVHCDNKVIISSPLNRLGGDSVDSAIDECLAN